MNSLKHSLSSIRSWRKGRKWLEEHPEGTVRISPHLAWDRDRFMLEWWNAMHDRINARAGIYTDDELALNYRLDQRTIHRYLFDRVRCSGSRGMLRTRKLQKIYAYINNQPWKD